MYRTVCSAHRKLVQDNNLDAGSPSATSPLQDQSPTLKKYSVLLRFLASPDGGGSAVGSESKSTAHATPSWERDPTPLVGWSIEEQSVLLDMMRKCPPALRRNSDQRHTVYFRLVTDALLCCSTHDGEIAASKHRPAQAHRPSTPALPSRKD